MKLCGGTLLIGVVATSLAAPASAGQLRLEIHAGRVTLVAQDVTIGQILDEWSRVGQTTVTITGDGLPVSPVTLQLTSVPEQEALDVILRSASGYVAAQRPVETPGLSFYDRILVLGANAVASPPPRLTIPLPPVEAQSAADVSTLAGPAAGEVEAAEVQEEEEDGAQVLPAAFQESGPARETAQPARGVPPGPLLPAGFPAGTPRPGLVAPAPQPLSDLMPD